MFGNTFSFSGISIKCLLSWGSVALMLEWEHLPNALTFPFFFFHASTCKPEFDFFLPFFSPTLFAHAVFIRKHCVPGTVPDVGNTDSEALSLKESTVCLVVEWALGLSGRGASC